MKIIKSEENDEKKKIAGGFMVIAVRSKIIQKKKIEQWNGWLCVVGFNLKF